MLKLLTTCSILLALAVPALAQSKSFPAKVVRCYDGDSITVEWQKGKRARTVRQSFRLIGIDAPEVRGNQPYRKDSQQLLCDPLLGRDVVIEPRGFDTKWTRKLVKATFRGQDLSLLQLQRGAAWFYRQYARSLTPDERKAYAEAEAAAKAADEGKGRGLWMVERDPPVPPWQWRKGKRSPD